MEAYILFSSKLFFHLNFLLLLLLLPGLMGNSQITRCREKERRALTVFKEGLKDEYGVLSSWETDDDCCKWKGVRCNNQTSHVIALHLNSLGGKLTPSLLQLEYLTYLDLSLFHSSKDAAIPEFIGSLKRLKYLNLSQVNFVGEIHVQLFLNLSNLQCLDLSSSFGHLFVKNLSFLSHLSSLRYLDLSRVNLSLAHDWTQEIDKLPFLKELKLRRCELPLPKSARSSFNFSTSLSILDLSDNNFGIQLSSFQWLLNHSATLTGIQIGRSQFFGGIPPEFGRFQSLEYLDVSWSMLEGQLTNSIGNISSLMFLDLSHNKFNGTIPPSLLNLPKLKTLRLCENLFQGELPEFLSSSPLIELDLHGNKLNGSLPQSMGNLTELGLMDFSSNCFNGSVTEVHFHNLSKLTRISLYHNSLILELNSNWVPPFNLTHLNLNNCKIGPHFPSWLRTQTYLLRMELFGCGIDDVLPNWFGHNFPQLSYLNLSNNLIHGNLPHWSCDFGCPEVIDLSTNKFENPMTSICHLSTGYLSYLDLSNNLFSGIVPNCLTQLSKLVYLNLEKNKFSGELPSSIGLLNQIQSLHLRHNSFDGELPASLQRCKLLRVIDFGHNKFTGEIPRWVGRDLQNLAILSLPSNQFQGTMPSTLCHLRKLHILDLSNNNICGIIPNCIGNLRSMAKEVSPQRSIDIFTTAQDFNIEYPESASFTWKGVELEYNNILELVKSIDLSNNNLSGEIPYEITQLERLLGLNISGNNLDGNIPREIGHLQQLEFLDLSKNKLSGEIPLSLSQLHFIGFLNLSTNNLSGRIPWGNQLQSFSASSYSKNPGLCGLPLPKPCPKDQRNFSPTNNRDPHQVEEEEDDDGEEEWFKRSSFYAANGFGFAFGLCGTLTILLVSRSCRITYFRLVSDMQDSFHVLIVVKMAAFKRLFKN